MPAARGDPSASTAAAAAAVRCEDRRRNRSRASSFVYFLLFKVGVKVNAAAEKFPRARLLISRYQIANLETALDYPATERSPSSQIREPKST